MLAKLPRYKPIREKYRPMPNASERRHHVRLLGLPCICCGKRGGIIHHVLTDGPDKRWRRDHLVVLPMADECHRSLHGQGDEFAWCMARGFEPVREAVRLRDESKRMGVI